jgi:hypothetical protein
MAFFSREPRLPSRAKASFAALFGQCGTSPSCLRGVQCVQIRNAVDTEHHGRVIENELPLQDFPCRLDDPWISVGPVVATSRDQAHAVAVALQPEPVAVVILDFMQPVRAGGNAGRSRGDTEIEGLKLAAKIRRR